jgi:HSP20 family protein
MAAEQTRTTQPERQSQQPRAGQSTSGQSTQEIQRRDQGQQTGVARRGGRMPSLFRMDPFEMLRMSPFALMRRFSEEMDQWFEQRSTGRGGLFAPPVEVFDRNGQLVVRADLPGLTKDDIRVEVTNDAVIIEGERRSEHEERQGGIFRSERSYGTFHRQIPLPEGINTEQATASFKDGVLEITMPAPQMTRGRRIDIQSGTTGGAGQQASSGTGQQFS